MKNLKLKGLKFSKGKCELFNTRVIFSPPQLIEVLSSIYGEGVKSLLVWLGKKSGWNLAQVWEENLQPKTLEDLVDQFCTVLTNQGWGRFEPREVSEQQIIIDLHHNISSKLENQAKYICYFIDGLLTGFGEFALYRVNVNETECCVDDPESTVCTYKIQKIS